MTTPRWLLVLTLTLVSFSAFAQLPSVGQSFALQSVSTNRYLGASGVPQQAESLVLSEIENKEGIYESIKKFLGKGK